MPEFKVYTFGNPQKINPLDFEAVGSVPHQIEKWLNSLRTGGYYVNIQDISVMENGDILVTIFRYIPSMQPKVLGDVSQPEPYQEPTIHAD